MTVVDLRTLMGRTVVDLAHTWFRGMPASPNQPPFQLAMVKRHGDDVKPDGQSAASEIFVKDEGVHQYNHGHSARLRTVWLM